MSNFPTTSDSIFRITQAREAFIHHLLPDEMVVWIFSYLKVKDLMSVQRVYSRWSPLSAEPSLWQSLCLHLCIDSFKSQRPKESNDTFKETFKRSVLVRTKANSLTSLRTNEIFTSFYSKVVCIAVDQKSLIYSDLHGKFHITLDHSKEHIKWEKQLQLFSWARLACGNQKFVVGTTDSVYKTTFADIHLNQENPIRYLGESPGNPVFSVLVHQDSYYSGEANGHKQWDIETGNCTQSFSYEGSVVCLAAEAKNNVQVICKVEAEKLSKISIWDSRTNSCCFEYTTDLVTSVAVQDNTLVSSTYFPKAYEIRDLRMNKSNQCLRIFDNDISPFTAIHGDLLVGATTTNISLYSLITGECFNTLEAHKNRLCSIAMHNNQIFAASQGLLKIWNIPA